VSVGDEACLVTFAEFMGNFDASWIMRQKRAVSHPESRMGVNEALSSNGLHVTLCLKPGGRLCHRPGICLKLLRRWQIYYGKSMAYVIKAVAN